MRFRGLRSLSFISVRCRAQPFRRPASEGAPAVSKPAGVFLVLAIAVLAAVIVGYATYSLMRADRATVPAALIRAAIAFAGTLTLFAVVTATVHAVLT
jgi:hypothetical protein